MIKYKIRKYKSWPFGWTRFAVYILFQSRGTGEILDTFVKRGFWSTENAIEYIAIKKKTFQDISNRQKEEYRDIAEERPGDITLE